MNTFKLEEKSAIILGGLGGYSIAIAQLILKRGGRVLLADLKEPQDAKSILSCQFEEAQESKRVIYVKCDVRSEKEIENAFKVAHKDLVSPDNSVDILINGAGIVGEQQWEKLYDINIVSAITVLF